MSVELETKTSISIAEKTKEFYESTFDKTVSDSLLEERSKIFTIWANRSWVSLKSLTALLAEQRKLISKTDSSFIGKKDCLELLCLLEERLK